ncbi:hypothetical protein [Rubneribacter badeniensis]|uniref:hypothetical protein n=1 Tax=Rubneribacter badeniensis TaxID=2070688 RepID=UPI003A8F0782
MTSAGKGKGEDKSEGENEGENEGKGKDADGVTRDSMRALDPPCGARADSLAERNRRSRSG